MTGVLLMSETSELKRFVTADGETLHGLLYRGGAQAIDCVLVMIHGVAMNFYTGPLPVLARALSDRGYHCLSMNTRGHDWIARSGDLTAFGGAAYEIFDECLLDIDGVLDGLRRQGIQRFVLVGHSLGSVKVLFYAGRRQPADVVGVVSCSAPKQFYSARTLEDPDFPARMRAAEALVADDNSRTLMWAPASGATGLFSAGTYVSKYGPNEVTDVRPHAKSLRCPLLAVAGAIEAPYFREYAEELAAAAGDRAAYVAVPRANHFYAGCEPVVADAIDEWLRKKDLISVR